MARTRLATIGLSVSIFRNGDNSDLSHTIHSHPDGLGPSFQELQTLGDLLKINTGAWEVIVTKTGDLLLSGAAGLHDFGLTTTSPGVHEGPPSIYQVTLTGAVYEAWRGY